MNCPDCNHENTSIVDTRSTEGGEAVRRRRECPECQFRFTTYERKDWQQLRVKKADGSTELYDTQKVRRGIELAVEKRPVSSGQIDEIVSQVTDTIESKDESLVDSNVIGRVVAKQLREIDQVAFIRFASVYEDYSDAEDFMSAANGLLSDATSMDSDEHSTQTS